MGDEVKITVIATGFAPKEAQARVPAPRQASVPAIAPVAAARAAPQPLPARAEPRAEPRPEPRPAAPPVRVAPAPETAAPRVRPVARAREVGAYDPGNEDHYDIPAFLRRGGQQRE
jgi:cell division protein FtsZ